MAGTAWAADPIARAQTPTFVSGATAAYGAAIWVDRENRASSLVFGTDQINLPGVRVYDARTGAALTDFYSGPVRGIAVAYGLLLEGAPHDVALLAALSGEVAVYLVAGGPSITPGGSMALLGVPTAVAAMPSPDGGLWGFVADSSGTVSRVAFGEADAGALRFAGALAGQLNIGGTIDGLAVDQAQRTVYYSTAGGVLGRFSADSLQLMANVATLTGVTLGGLALYPVEDGGMVLLAARRTTTALLPYVRDGAGQWQAADPLKLRTAANLPAGDTYGIAVAGAPIPGFDGGLFVSFSAGTDPSFQLYGWEDLAKNATPLLPVNLREVGPWLDGGEASMGTDAGPGDAGLTDGGLSDAGTVDGGTRDGGAGGTATRPPTSGDVGVDPPPASCGCAAAPALPLALFAAALAWHRRRRS